MDTSLGLKGCEPMGTNRILITRYTFHQGPAVGQHWIHATFQPSTLELAEA